MNGEDLVNYLNSLGFEKDSDHVWGYQLRALNSLLYAAKFLIFTNDTPGSLHTHGDDKDETFICLAGAVLVEHNNLSMIIHPGQTLRVPFGVVHRTRAVSVPSVLLEVSTHDDDGFTHRLEEGN